MQKKYLQYCKFAYWYGKKYKNEKDKEITKKLLKKKPCTIPSIFDELADRIESGKPMLLARLGSSEGAITGSFCEKNLGEKKSYEDWLIDFFYLTSGFFSDDYDNKEKAIDEYAQLTLNGIGECDYLSAFWPSRPYMPFFFKYYAKNTTPTFSDFGPYFDYPTSRTWLRALEGKRVLVINSFTESIEQQYKRKEKLVKSKEYELPVFELLTYKTFVTQVGERPSEFKNFFQVLDKMIDDIKKIDFDIALIGAGAYGFPLAVEVKRMGKIALETCGATPLFFGIYGERQVRHGIEQYITDAWIRPIEEPPKRFKEVEGGCYW